MINIQAPWTGHFVLGGANQMEEQMDGKTASELIQDLVDIHCRTLIRFQRRQELLQEQDEDDDKFSNAASLLKPLLSKLEGPIHYRRGYETHYAIRVDSDTGLVLVEPMLDMFDLELEDDRLISDDCCDSIEKELAEMQEDNDYAEASVLIYSQRNTGTEPPWEQNSNDGQ